MTIENIFLPVGIVDYFLLIGPSSIPNSENAEEFKTFDNHSCIDVKTWDRYPKKNHTNISIPENIEQFACPNGSRFVSIPEGLEDITTNRPALEYFSFVMSGDEEQYAACIKFFLLVHISEIEDNHDPESTVVPSDILSSMNWWQLNQQIPYDNFEEERFEFDYNKYLKKSYRKLHYIEITLCLLTRGGSFLPQLTQYLSHIYTNDILPSMESWEKSVFENSSKINHKICPIVLNCISKLHALCLSCPAPIPGALDIALSIPDDVHPISCYVGSNYITHSPRLLLPGESNNKHEFMFSLPSNFSLPSSPHPVELLFQYMGPRGAIDLLSCALCEKKILLHSFDISKLPVIGEGLRTLLYPLRWTHVYVPVVPVELLNLVEAPVPFILGVDTR